MAYEIIWCTSIILYKHCKGNSIQVVTKNIIRNCNAYENLLKARNSKYISLNGIKEHLICFISSGRSAIVSDIISQIGGKGNRKIFEEIIQNSKITCNFELWGARECLNFCQDLEDSVDIQLEKESSKKIRWCAEGHENEINRKKREYCTYQECKALLNPPESNDNVEDSSKNINVDAPQFSYARQTR